MLKKSLIIATCITLSLFGIILYIGTLYAQYNPGTGTQYPPKHSGQGGRDFGYYFHEVGTAGTYIQYYGTQSVTGSGTTGRIIGTSSALPHVEYAYAGGTPTFNFVGATLQNEGVDVTVSSDLSGYIAVTGGTGTGNTLTNTTLAGAGTISASIALSGNITANSLEITPAELGYLNNASSEIQAQITTATGSITNHTHTGADGTTQIAHDSVTGTGTNSHATLDTFVSSKAQASGLASLDGSSLVVQNPANSTATPTASKILIADGAGKIADGWLNSTITALGQTIELGTETTGNTDNVAEGSNNLYYLDSRVNVAVGSLSVAAHSDIVFTSPAEGHTLVFDASLNVINATDTAIVAWPGITGIPTDNGSVSVTSGAGYIPVAGSDGKLDYSWQKDVIRLTGTTTSPEAGAFGQLYVQRSNSSGTLDIGAYHIYLPLTVDFRDLAVYNFSGTATGAVISGTMTAAFVGNADYITYPDDGISYEIATNGEMTIQGWYNFYSVASNKTLWSHDDDNNNMTRLQWINTNNLRIYQEEGAATTINVSASWTPSTDTWYFIEANRNTSGGWEFYVDGSLKGAGTDTTGLAARTNDIVVGNDGLGFTSGIMGYVSDFSIALSDLNNGTYVPTIRNTSISYTQYSAKYTDPVNGNTVFEILTPGTATTQPSYIYNNATTTVWGLGTNTAITSGTATGYYAGWTNRPIRVSAVDIASTKKIKENIMPIHIKPEQLEAESKAKPVYIADKKPAWFAANETNYTYVGSDTATYVDNTAMESAYADYIELEWASDPNQSVYIDAVQKAQQKYFWGLFDKIQPKSWNPIDDLRMTRKGLVVEDVPDEIKGADGQSIDQMAVTTYQTLVLQELKDSVVDIMHALSGLAATGTFTTQAIDDRLEVMRIAQ